MMKSTANTHILRIDFMDSSSIVELRSRLPLPGKFEATIILARHMKDAESSFIIR